jgi:hypothetical protein
MFNILEQGILKTTDELHREGFLKDLNEQT